MRAEHQPHRRYNPLTREWVLVSPQRLARPWLGHTEPTVQAARPAYDPTCYLCPGNVRAGAARNPEYTGTFVFDNDYPALLPPDACAPRASGEEDGPGEDGLLVSHAEAGLCRVVCFSPRHDAALSDLSVEELRGVVDVWADQFHTLGELPWVTHVQIFENRGERMGASNPHPHGQIWASAALPDIPAREQAALLAYRADRGGDCLLCRYIADEERHGERVVYHNDGFAAVVPFWAVWPFEILVIARPHVAAIDALGPGERAWLADVLKQIASRYDRLFDAPCPYSMGFHQRPTDGQPHDEWHLHAHFYPPVLRSATVHKFMVGYELLATPQRDLTAEAAAARLRQVAAGAEIV